MSKAFRTLALLGKANSDDVNQTISALYDFLTAQHYKVLVESRLSRQLSCPKTHCMDVVELGKQADLAIVVGGDGHMLGAARVLARYNVPVIGVNRGNLGFLTDLSPHDFQDSLQQVLSGDIRQNIVFCWKRLSIATVSQNRQIPRSLRRCYTPVKSRI